MKLCPTSRRKQQENTFLMRHISETNERQFHCIKACFQGKLNRIYPFYKAVTIQSKPLHLTCKDMGYQHPLAPPMQLSVLTCRTQQTDLCQCRNISQEYIIFQPHWMKPVVPNQWPPHIIFQAFERQFPNCVQNSTDHFKGNSRVQIIFKY